MRELARQRKEQHADAQAAQARERVADGAAKEKCTYYLAVCAPRGAGGGSGGGRAAGAADGGGGGGGGGDGGSCSEDDEVR